MAASSPHFPTTEDLRHTRSFAGAELSPDGRYALFTVAESAADGGATHLWITPVAGGEPRQITRSPEGDKRGEHNASWAPDGKAVYFLAHRGDHTQLFRLPMTGGEAMPYSLKVMPAVDTSRDKDAVPPPDVKGGKDAKGAKDGKPAGDSKDSKDSKPEPIEINVSGYALSPDGTHLAVWASDPETPGEKKAREAKADAVWVDHERHGERLYVAAMTADGHVVGELAASATLTPVALAPDVQSASWSPMSDRLLVVTEPPNGVPDLAPAAQAWVVPVAAAGATAAASPTLLAGLPHTIRGGFGWRQDGLAFAFAAQSPEDAPPGTEDLYSFALPMDAAAVASAAPVRLMAAETSFSGSLGYGELLFHDGEILAPVAVGTRLGYATFSPAAAAAPTPSAAAAPTMLASEWPVTTGLTTNRARTGWLWSEQASDQAPRLCYGAKPGDSCKALAVPEMEPTSLRAAKSQLIHWTSDKFTIEGLLYLPPEASTGKVPLIVDVHGGPLGAWEDRYDLWAAFLLGHGWAILRPNPRGSSAYGWHFAAANKNDLGGGDFRDVMAGVDAAVKNFPIDADRLALIGYSYGGEMAGFAEGKTDRFKAIVAGAPVIDQFSEYGTESGSWYDRWYYGKPWLSMADAWRQSPLSGVGQAKTPFLLLQGEGDTTDPLGQSQEMYRALRQQGVPVEMVQYPRDNHGPLARAMFGEPVSEPWHGYDARQHVVDFLSKALGGSHAK